MKAKAAVFTGANKDFDIREFEITAPPAGYGRMELIASGICGTDLHIHRGRLECDSPSIIGHEFVGKLTAINCADGNDYGLSVGDNVIADIAVPCGKCALCLAGDDANCVNFAVTNDGSIETPPYMTGGYSEVNFTPLANLIKIPDTVDPVIAATFACPGPTDIHACSLAEKAGVDLAVNVAVVQGLGPVGIFAVMYLKRMGAKKVIAVAAHENPARAEAVLKAGADKVYTLSTDGADFITSELKKENGGIGVDLCFETSGAPKAVVQGMDILRNRGVYLIPGQYSNSGGIEIQPQIITFKALHIIGSSQYSICDVEKYLEFLRANPDLHGLILSLSKRYPVSQTNKAMADAGTSANIETLLIRG